MFVFPVDVLHDGPTQQRRREAGDRDGGTDAARRGDAELHSANLREGCVVPPTNTTKYTGA